MQPAQPILKGTKPGSKIMEKLNATPKIDPEDGKCFWLLSSSDHFILK
jgi:hypothetical protein